jgi:membrane associated rhomboid family serine protease
VVSFILILLAVAAGVAYRVSTPDERKRFYAAARESLGDVKAAAARPRPEYDAFRAALRARMRLVLVTPAIVFIVTAVFGGMLFGATAIGHPDTLVAWGASAGTRTTNGEWWRLVTSAFVHDGMLHFVIDVAILIQLGLILERLVGRVTFAAVYVFAGVFGSLVNLSSHPVAVTVSASSTIFGLYGLLAAALIWQSFQRWRGRSKHQEGDAQELVAPDVTIPLIALRRLAVGGALFFTYSTFSGRAHAAEFAGLLVGMMYGVVLARRAGEEEPAIRLAGYALLATIVVAAASAIAIGRITDVKPELERVVALEKSTAAAYQAEFDALKKGHATAEAVARLAEETIVSEFEAADTRLKTLTNVPREHQPALADAREYVRLRRESWRARGVSIRRSTERRLRPEGVEDTAWRLQLQARFKSDAAARANAEGAERASLEALERVARFLTEHA